MQLGILYFSAVSDRADAERRRVKQICRAEALGLSFVSFPERHFDRFGGSFPNPLLHCAIAASHTSRISIRTGSLIPALHNPVRLKEDLRVLDRLCDGRLQLSLGSGWNPNDFAVCPEMFSDRREWLSTFIADFNRWYFAVEEGLKNGLGDSIELAVHPSPSAHGIDLWLTISSNLEAWRHAGQQGLNVLSHMENVDHEALAARVQAYRHARCEAGLDPRAGRVTLMQHAAVFATAAEKQSAERSLRAYLEHALALERRAVDARATMSGNKAVNAEQLADSNVVGDIVDRAFARYREAASLVCDPAEAIHRLRTLEELGIDEVACLIDFVADLDEQDRCLEQLGQLREQLHTDTRVKSNLLEAFCS